jgi:cell wall-associated NlpC family hydrolase
MPPTHHLARTLALAAALLAAQNTWAMPVGDDVGQFMAERGLVEQIQQVGSDVRDKASDLVVHAMGFLGVPYKRGGNSVETGFDCSGFVRAIYEQSLGLVLPRKASDQAAATQSIDKSELQPGDLVFFNTLRAAFSHVGIYVGDNKFIHSPRSGSAVRVEDMRLGYWQTRFNGARRVDGSAPASAVAAKPKTTAAAATPTKPDNKTPNAAALAEMYRN